MLEDYPDVLNANIYTPREYFEHQLHMSDEEIQHRTEFFTKLFADHEEMTKQRESAQNS